MKGGLLEGINRGGVNREGVWIEGVWIEEVLVEVVLIDRLCELLIKTKQGEFPDGPKAPSYPCTIS